MDGTVKEVQKTGPLGKHLHPVFFLRQMVVDILKLHRFGVKGISQPADPIPVHFTVGDALLDRLRGICFQPGKKAAFFRRLGTGRLSFALLCIGSGLFGLPDVFLQTLFLSFLLLVFWQSL